MLKILARLVAVILILFLLLRASQLLMTWLAPAPALALEPSSAHQFMFLHVNNGSHSKQLTQLRLYSLTQQQYLATFTPTPHMWLQYFDYPHQTVALTRTYPCQTRPRRLRDGEQIVILLEYQYQLLSLHRAVVRQAFRYQAGEFAAIPLPAHQPPAFPDPFVCQTGFMTSGA